MEPVEEIKQEEAQIEEKEETVACDVKEPERYACKKCRRVVFSSAQLEAEHASEAKEFFTRPQKKGDNKYSKECSSFFLEQQEWMLEQCNEQQQGKLACPHAKCGYKLGAYSYYGAQCSCGKWACPAFQIHKSSVDRIIKVDLQATRSDIRQPMF